jgi:hypothetical protein
VQWSVSAEQYIKNSVKTIESKLHIEGLKLNPKKYSPMGIGQNLMPPLSCHMMEQSFTSN